MVTSSFTKPLTYFLKITPLFSRDTLIAPVWVVDSSENVNGLNRLF